MRVGERLRPTYLDPMTLQTSPLDAPVATPDDVSTRRMWSLARWSAVLMLGAALFWRRSTITTAVADVGNLPGITLFGLVAMTLLYKLAMASLLAMSTEGLGLKRAFLASEAATGATNSTVAGSTLGTGLKVAMLQSWGLRPRVVGASLLATAVIPGLAMWLLATVQAAGPTLMGDATSVVRTTFFVGLTALGAQLTFWLWALNHDKFARLIGRPAVPLQRRLATWSQHCKNRHLRRLAHGIADRDVNQEIDRLRQATASLTRRRGLALLGAGAVAQLALALVLLLAVRGLGTPDAAASTLEVLRAFAVMRVAASFVPVPGGLGVLDIGLVGALTQAGANHSVAIAAVAIYRAWTFFLPMLTGGLVTLAWQRSQARKRCPSAS